MGWLDGWGKRIPIAVDNSTPSALNDVLAPVPGDLDEFWDTIDASGFEIRVTESDGITAVTAYQWSGFNKTNKAGAVEIDGLTCHASDAGVCLAWLYYDKTGASDGSSAFTPAGQVSGYIHGSQPSGFVVRSQQVKAGAPRPAARIQKTVGEAVYVWFEVRGLLEKRQTESSGSLIWEEIQRVVSAITDGGTPQAGMVSASKTRFIEIATGPLRGFYVGVYVQAGTTATNYTIEPVFSTYAPEITISGSALVFGPYRTLEPRALLRVEDIDED